MNRLSSAAAFQCCRPSVSTSCVGYYFPLLISQPMMAPPPHLQFRPSTTLLPDWMAPPRQLPSSTAIMATGAVEAAALGFFSGIRIPAALIAGSSLSAFFSLVGDKSGSTTKNIESDAAQDRWQDNLVVLYHILSLVSLLLSLNVVITATAAGTTLLLETPDSVAMSAFEFLRQEMYFELLTTRWSFFTSLLCFIGAVTTRSLLEFDLLKPKRRKLAACFLLMMGAGVAHLVSFINDSLYSSPNLMVMTLEVIKVLFARAVEKRSPLEFISALFSCSATAVGISIIREKRRASK